MFPPDASKKHGSCAEGLRFDWMFDGARFLEEVYNTDSEVRCREGGDRLGAP